MEVERARLESLARSWMSRLGGGRDEEGRPRFDGVYAELKKRCALTIGEKGFAALFVRGIRRSRSLYPGLGAVHDPDHFAAVLSELPLDEARDVFLAVVTEFLSLLAQFIGPDLTARLLGDPERGSEERNSQ